MRTLVTVLLPALVLGLGPTLGERAANANVGPFGPVETTPPPKPAGAAGGQEVSQVSPTTLTCDVTMTFEDLAGGGDPGTNYDGIILQNGGALAERFAGQTLSFNGNFDVLSGTPSNPLTLQTGAAGRNLNVLTSGTNVVDGLGPLGYPNPDAIGEGAVAVLFDVDQFEFGLRVVGTNEGSATVRFYRRNGTLIDTIVLSPVANIAYGFRRMNSTVDIGGITIVNDDPAGIGYDDICVHGGATPAGPATWGLIKARFES